MKHAKEDTHSDLVKSISGFFIVGGIVCLIFIGLVIGS